MKWLVYDKESLRFWGFSQNIFSVKTQRSLPLESQHRSDFSTHSFSNK